MTRYNANLPLAVTQIKTKFLDAIGNVRIGIGTGFFISMSNKKTVFVTNKHNLEPKLLGIGEKYSLSFLEIRLRQYDGSAFHPSTRFVPVDLESTRLLHAETADVSIVIEPQFIGRSISEQHFSLNAEGNIADASFFKEKVEIMDHISFFGFPGTSAEPWWDTAWNLPIARIASIASPPQYPYSNDKILTDDVTLVSGLSFSGSSGSLVLLHQKGNPAGDIIDHNFVPPKIIGLMSGHFKEPALEPEMFRHAGLSYYTRSTAILELLNKIS